MNPPSTNPSDKNKDADKNPAAEMIRKKLEDLYATEPDTKSEQLEALEAGKHRSKHQAYMFELTSSGKSLADIQTAWHNYYNHLNDKEKHEVWAEFYANHGHGTQTPAPTASADQPTVLPQAAPRPEPEEPEPTTKTKHHRRTVSENHSVADLKRTLLRTSDKRHKLKGKQHLQSLVFGLATGSIVIVILLFSFFNERFIAPFITPSKHVSSTPIIIDPNSAEVTSTPEIIIPKINVEIPVVYDEPSIADAAVETALERGVVHYATTPDPGEKGNAVIFGHSSNNIFNPGKYKFAFVLLSRLESGDLFYLNKDGKQYAYKVYEKDIVKSDDVAVLGNTNKVATATLITCDPPGTSINRLVVIGEQISPDPSTDTASTAVKSDTQPTIIPSNAPSLWSRLTSIFHH